jgi:hypothetical protein
MIEIEFAQTSRHRYKVYGWKNVYTISQDKANSLVLPSNLDLNSYRIWSHEAGIDIGSSHGMGLFSHLLIIR